MFHAYQVPSFCLLPSGYLIVCFVHVSVCASVQLEMHRPENTNKITDVGHLHVLHFILYLTFTSLYTLRHKLSITQTLFQRHFYVQISSKEQPVCNIMLPLSSCGLLNISECHLVILLNFYGVLYTPTPILGVYP